MSDKTRNQVLLVLFLGVLMGALDIAIVAPALPSIQAFFGVDDRLLAWTFSIYVLFNLIGTPLMAKLSDTYGRRAVYVADVTLFALGSLLVALTPQTQFGVLLAGRAIQGLGAGGIFPVASAVIGDTFPPEKRGGALGLIGAVFGLAFLVGPILGGILLSVAGWQWLFIINLPIAAVVAGMGLRLLPATRPEQRKAFDLLGMAVLGVMLAALAYGLNQLDSQSFFVSLTSLTVWPFLAAAVGLALVFAVVERRAEDPVLNLGLFRSRQTVLASLLSAGAGLGEVGMVFIPSLAIAALPTVVDKHTASYLLMPVVLALAVGSPTVGRLLDRLGSKVVVIGGSALLALGMLLLSIPGWTSSLWLFIVAGAIIGLGLSALLGAPVRYIMLNEAGASERTAGQGAIALFTSIGQLVSSALVGAVAASFGGGVGGYGAAYLAVGVIAVIMVVLAFGLKSRAQERAAGVATSSQGGR
ncbi:MAG: MFS transporter [Anaerolineales bacterium]|nr:MFS transporter [Anaerolineales bacterium]